MESFDLSAHGLSVKTVLRNAAPSKLYEEAIRFEPGTTISDTGALIAYSGEKTGFDAKLDRKREGGAEKRECRIANSIGSPSQDRR